jgi:hypothetical protein
MKPMPIRPDTTAIAVDGERLVIENLTILDPALARQVGETPDGERPALVERALRIGLLAISSTAVTVNLDVVRGEFADMTRQMHDTNERAADVMAATLREHFADGDGRLPRQLEAFLGDSGRLQRMVSDLFDPKRRESALGQLQDLLGRYFDGDSSRLALLLDPLRPGSPLAGFRTDILDGLRQLADRMTALEAGNKARAEERAKGTAKGDDFEAAIETRLADFVHGSGDILERTGGETGDALRSKKGDFVISVDPSRSRGVDLRIAVEAKDRSVSLRRFGEELKEMRDNRRAVAALAIFTPAAAPSGIAPLQIIGSDVYCVFDPEADDATALEAAYRLVRLLALVSLREASVQLDVAAVQGALDDIVRSVGEVQGMKTKLTSISRAAEEVSSTLDTMRAAINRGVRAVEDQLRVIEDEGSSDTLTAAV